MVLLGRLGLALGLSIGLVFRVRVSINIKLLVLHFIHLRSVDGATVRRSGPSNFVHLIPSSPNWAYH